MHAAPIYLDVPFLEKDRAKALGAKWDAISKRWFIPPGLKSEAFVRWLPTSKPTPRELEQPAISCAKLTPSWMPKSTFGTKLDNFVSSDQKRILRSKIALRDGDCCSICGSRGPSSLFMDWDYIQGCNGNSYGLQKLKSVSQLCPMCNKIKYYGINRLKGDEEAMLNHLCVVCNLTRQEAIELVHEHERIFAKYDRIAWDIDVSVLKEYGIVIADGVLEKERARRRTQSENGCNARTRDESKGGMTITPIPQANSRNILRRLLDGSW